MESKSNRRHPEEVLLWMILAALSIWGIVATVRTVRRDGLRRVPTAPLARRPAPRP
ncbi:hypothetical protein [Aeromicrobium flavum]|uniref:hypothetical protein n=1 Tax=Aeromicrobium flavum TaxID=416568 RepID=UPI001649A211|nr:hypothetical protein [Aeromicrobium flavum]